MKVHDGIACIKCEGYCNERIIEFDIDGKKVTCEAFVCDWCQEPIMDTQQMKVLLNAYKSLGKKEEVKQMIRKRKQKEKLQKSKRFPIDTIPGFDSILSNK